MHANANNREALQKVWELIKDIDTAMLTTVSDEGLVSRPMQTQDIEFDGDLWFLTKKDTGKFHELLRNRQVNVAYAGKSYVSIRGQAELVDDTGKIKELWKPAHAHIMGTSYDDPNLVLIKVSAETAEYWESGNMLKTAKFMFNRMLGRNTEGTELNRLVEIK